MSDKDDLQRYNQFKNNKVTIIATEQVDAEFNYLEVMNPVAPVGFFVD